MYLRKYSDITRDFFGRPISAGGLGRGGGRGMWCPIMGPVQCPGEDQAAKLLEASRFSTLI